jgi:hypothetical protein
MTAIDGSTPYGYTRSARFTGPNSGTDITTSSTSFVTLTGYTASIAAAVDDVLEIAFSGSHYCTNVESADFTVAYNGTNAGPIFRHKVGASNTAQNVSFTVQHVVVSGDLSSGSVSVTIKWKMSAGGTATFWADSSGITGQLAVKNLAHTL